MSLRVRACERVRARARLCVRVCACECVSVSVPPLGRELLVEGHVVISHSLLIID